MVKNLEQLLQNEKPEIVRQAKVLAQETLLEIRLSELREKARMTQQQIAESMNVRQPTIAGMEKQGHDIKLSTLKKYVEATGGKLRVTVEYPDGDEVGFLV